MKTYDKEFKEDAVAYVKSHPELSVAACARNLGVNENTLHGWLHKVRNNEEFRGSGNYRSDEAKEIARLKKELQAHKDALRILKKTIKILGEDQ
ncbi:MAG: transposase [Saccharofermentanales bacterium]|jgi:transposase